jgi:staphylococcal nuclease domain-containing protein 1
LEAQVVRVWTGDQISVYSKELGKELRLQLSSVRAAKANDTKQAYYANEAKEFLRKKLIGKTVKVHVDYVKPREGEYEERECATIRYGKNQTNIAEQLITEGLATAVRHRRDDENRAPDYDKLMAAEQSAVTESRGLHSGKEIAIPRIGNASETAARANQFLSSFKRVGRVPAIVDYVAAGSRFKLYVPKENQSLTFVLAGIRAPRTARNPSEKSEPYGAEALEFSTHHYMQRDVEVEFETVDKSGGFIGALYLNKTENAAITLAREGLAFVHEYSAQGLPWAKQLFDAEEEAKAAKKNIWQDYTGAAEEKQDAAPEGDNSSLKTSYFDVIVSDVRGPNAFSVQMLNNDGISALEKLMHDFSLHHRAASNVPGFTPQAGELVSARFSGDRAWYRAKVKRCSPAKKEAELVFIDYGNQETLKFSDIRPLDAKFKSLPGQAQDARLSFVKLVGPESEYHAEAMDKFRSLIEGRKLVANVDHREGQLLHLRLIDPADANTKSDPLACINADLVRDGLAMIDRKECRYLSAYPAVLGKLQEAIEGAKRDRLGMFELGDVSPDDE